MFSLDSINIYRPKVLGGHKQFIYTAYPDLCGCACCLPCPIPEESRKRKSADTPAAPETAEPGIVLMQNGYPCLVPSPTWLLDMQICVNVYILMFLCLATIVFKTISHVRLLPLLDMHIMIRCKFSRLPTLICSNHRVPLLRIRRRNHVWIRKETKHLCWNQKSTCLFLTNP